MMKLFVMLLLLALSGANPNSYQIVLPNGLKINAEIAKDKQKGLQGRKSLCLACGMVFIFDDEGYYAFWMRDTLINLAILWINDDGKVVYMVKNAKPCVGKQNPYTDCKVYSPPGPAKYVLEVNPDAANGIEVGMKIKSNPPL
jgi:uncharacterized membrane protein (UPF0127 family)